MIKYMMYEPRGILADYVRFFWSLDARLEEMKHPFVHRALPDNCIELIFYCSGRLSISSEQGNEGHTFSSGVFGQAQNFRQFKTENSFHIFGVYLYPYSFKILFDLPASELLNMKVDSQTLWGLEGKMLEEQVITAASDSERVQLLSQFFFKKIIVVRSHENNIIRNIKEVIDNNKLLSVQGFANHCNLSRRQFERKFKEFSGFSPKDFFQVVRFKNVLQEIGGRIPLAQIAMNTGYYDQSHLTNEFKRLSGYSPREFAINQPEAADTRATIDFK